MKSMTGFADAKIDTSLMKGFMQMKSWNNRYLELSLQLPGQLNSIERKIREYIESRITRGKVEFTIKLRLGHTPSSIVVDEANARSTADALRKLAKAAGIREPVRLSHLLAIEGLLTFERDTDNERLWLELEPLLSSCMEAFEKDRQREGDATAADLEAKLFTLEEAIGTIASLAPGLENTIKHDLRKRFTDVMGDLVDESRILVELASYLAKHTINEELVRFRSHLASFKSTMKESSCGKKLDFICQELNREANTIGSKTFTPEVSAAVIVIKDAIENIREQIRNIE